MFIILIAHIPNNWLAQWVPGRFGFSDATEVFVFCSGMASAIAFGKVFRERGAFLGTARVAHRVWQVYWAHIGLFIALASTLAALNATGLFQQDYLDLVNLHPFFDHAETNLPALMTLTYVPNYFDVLPMYIVALALMPLVVILGGFSRYAAFALVIAIWLGATLGGWSLPAEPWSDREWYFNPFGWQLIFFTGFGFITGWLPPPPVNRALVIAAALVLLASAPLSYYRIIEVSPQIQQFRLNYDVLIQKTDFGVLRYVHFLALAYLAWVAVGPGGRRLLPPTGFGRLARVWRRGLAIIMKVGQQSLAVFIASMFVAQILGMVFDVVGRNHFSMFYVNLFGSVLIVAVAYSVSWFKSQPWRRQEGKHHASS